VSTEEEAVEGEIREIDPKAGGGWVLARAVTVQSTGGPQHKHGGIDNQKQQRVWLNFIKLVSGQEEALLVREEVVSNGQVVAFSDAIYPLRNVLRISVLSQPPPDREAAQPPRFTNRDPEL
jgi:hypothetical protein